MLNGYIYPQYFSRVGAPGGGGPMLLAPMYAAPAASASAASASATPASGDFRRVAPASGASASAAPASGASASAAPTTSSFPPETRVFFNPNKPITGSTPNVPVTSASPNTPITGSKPRVPVTTTLPQCGADMFYHAGLGKCVCLSTELPPVNGKCTNTQCPDGMNWQADSPYDKIVHPAGGTCVCSDGSAPVGGKCGGTTVVFRPPPPKFCPDGVTPMPASGVCPEHQHLKCPVGFRLATDPSGTPACVPIEVAPPPPPVERTPPTYKPDGGPWPWLPGPTPNVPRVAPPPPVQVTRHAVRMEPVPVRATCTRCVHCGYEISEP